MELVEARLGGLVSVLAAVLGGAIVLGAGQYGYGLDDAWIHLALAEEIAGGHYGMYPSEASAPSSSVLWPFLLAPLARTPLGLWMPLLFNLVALVATAVGLRRCAVDGGWPVPDVVVVLLMLAANSFFLVHLGMENLLHQAVSVGIIWGLSREQPSVALWLLLGVAALIRYEALALVVPALVLLGWRGHGREACGVALAVGLLLIGFSAWLWSEGLGWLPASVVAKSGGGMLAPWTRLWSNLAGSPVVASTLAGGLLMGWASFRLPAHKGVAAVAAIAAVGHCMFGRFEATGRYEAGALGGLFAAGLLIAPPVLERFPRTGAAVATAVCLVGFPSWVRLWQLPALCGVVQQAHIPTRDFLDTHWNRPVAVNDLGVFSWRRDAYVLDLWGLGNIRALNHRRSGDPVEWMDVLAREEEVELAILFERWFPELPARWVPVADLHFEGPAYMMASDRMTFYATSPAAVAPLRRALESWDHDARTRLVMRQLPVQPR